MGSEQQGSCGVSVKQGGLALPLVCTRAGSTRCPSPTPLLPAQNFDELSSVLTEMERPLPLTRATDCHWPEDQHLQEARGKTAKMIFISSESERAECQAGGCQSQGFP